MRTRSSLPLMLLLAMSHAASSATFVVDTTNDAGDAVPGDGNCATLGGTCSLRAALQEANATVAPDVVTFAIPGGVPQAIQPTSALPALAHPVTIDGTTQPGWVGPPVIEIDGSQAGPSGSLVGLALQGGASIVRGLVVNHFNTGISLSYVSSGSVVQGCYIGTDAAGAVGVPQSVAINITNGSSDNQIGGAMPGQGNLLGKGGVALSIQAGSDRNLIQGNRIGTDITGTLSLAVSSDLGIRVLSADNVIGGTLPGAGNLVSGFSGAGVVVLGSSAQRNQILGNTIGTDITGTVALPNLYGISTTGPNTVVGGTTAGARNIVSGNVQGGIAVNGGGAGSVIQGNLVGTQADGVNPLGNGGHGIFVAFAPGVTVGGVAAGAGNTVAYSGGSTSSGVIVLESTGVAIRGNSIFANRALGISLSTSTGVIPNDPGDADTGANNLQNFPVLTSVATSLGGRTLGGTLNSVADASFSIDVFSNTTCDPTGFGEGEHYLGSGTVMTDSSGNTAFSFPLPTGARGFLTATATDSAGNTSEFSACLPIPACGDGVVDVGEQCDAGLTNGAPTSCCSAVCQFEPTTASCGGDNNLCTADRCDGAGTCQHLAEPDPFCLVPTVTGKAVLTVKNLAGVVAGDLVKFKWGAGPAVDVTDFGTDPSTGSPFYEMCIYDQNNGATTPVFRAQAFASPTCDGVPCWKASPGVGWKFKSKSGIPDGMTALVLKAGIAGKGKVQMKGKGTHLSLPTLPLAQSPSVVAQLRTSSGKCWGAVFSTHVKNDSLHFTGRSD